VIPGIPLEIKKPQGLCKPRGTNQNTITNTSVVLNSKGRLQNTLQQQSSSDGGKPRNLFRHFEEHAALWREVISISTE
jgi:hypothetical protein